MTFVRHQYIWVLSTERQANNPTLRDFEVELMSGHEVQGAPNWGIKLNA